MKDPIVMLQGTVEDMSANLIVAQLLYPESKMQISPSLFTPLHGGSVSRRTCYHDTNAVPCQSSTYICNWTSMSQWAVSAQAGEAGKRFVLPRVLQ